MAVTTQQYIRKPLYVDAVRITAVNFDEIAAWCQGEVMQDEVPGEGTTKKFIKVRVHNPKNPRQTKAFVGDWLLYTERGYKVYTNKAFHASFDKVEVEAPQNVSDPTAEAEELEGSSGLITGEQEITEGVTLNQAIASIRAEGATTEEVAPGVTLITGPVSGEVTTTVDKKPVGNVEAVPEQEKINPSAAEGKRVLSVLEQREMSPDDVRDLVQSGEAVLAQDIAQP